MHLCIDCSAFQPHILDWNFLTLDYTWTGCCRFWILLVFSQIQMFSVITSHCHARRLPHRLWKLQLRPCWQLNSCHNSNLRQHVSVCWTLWLYYDFNNSDAALIFEYECYLHHRSLDHRRRKLCMCQYHCPHLKRKCICPLLCCYRSISRKGCHKPIPPPPPP